MSVSVRRDDHEISGALCPLGGPNFAAMFLHGHQLALDSGVEAATFGEDIVLDRDRCDACRLILAIVA